jgi:hypothetical protein
MYPNSSSHKDNSSMSREELIEVLEITIENIKDLPDKALEQPITHYDFYSVLELLLSILRAQD